MSDWWAADPVSDRAPVQITVGPKGQGDWWASDPVAKSVGGDIARSAGSGLAKGVAGLIGLPEAVGSAGALGIDKATQFVASKLGVDGKRPEPNPIFTLPTTEQASQFIERNVTEPAGLPSPNYKPETKYGEFAKTATEFVPGAVLAPGGVVGNAIRYGVVPGLASEAAGQATKGSQFEPVARVAGALTGAGASALLSRPSTASRAIREQLPEGVTPQMVDRAAALIDEGAQQGITLSWPEALSQVAGRPVLTNTLRHLEGAPQTEARMAEFFGQRPRQVERAGRPALDEIAPPNDAPSTIGHAVGREAETAVNDVRGVINRASEPFYTAAETHRLTPAEMTRVRALPGYEEARAAVRNDPQLNRYVAGLPDDSVGFLNEVKKQLDTAAENASAPVNAQRNMQRSAGYGSDAEAVRDAGTRTSADYALALETQRELRTQYLDPLLQGPLGKIASKDTTTKAAIDALFPTKPLPNSADEIATTVGALAHRNPRAAADLVRAHTEGVFNEATRALQPGANQMGGAKFRAVLVGNPQQRANFEAAVTALPNGADRLAGFNRFLDVVEATGTRQNIGSRTAYNAEMLKGQAASGMIGEASKAVANPLKGAQFLADKYERWRLGQNLGELATILTNPQAVNQLRAISRMPPGSRQAEAVAVRLANIAQASGQSPVQQPRQ